MKKYRIYIDEVGNSDLNSSSNPEHRYLCLTGVIFDLEYVRTVLQPDLEDLKTRYFKSHPDDPVIMHRKELVHRKGAFSCLKDSSIENQFNNEYLSLLKKWDYTVISVTIDKQEHLQKYAQWRHDPYHYCQEILLERYRLFLNIKSERGDVMIESRGGAEDTRLKNSFRKLMDNGTHHIAASDLANHITSKELKVKPKNANISGLQIADLLAHSCRRYLFKKVLNMNDGKITFSDEIIAILEESKLFRYRNRIINYGIKKLP